MNIQRKLSIRRTPHTCSLYTLYRRLKRSPRSVIYATNLRADKKTLSPVEKNVSRHLFLVRYNSEPYRRLCERARRVFIT